MSVLFFCDETSNLTAKAPGPSIFHLTSTQTTGTCYYPLPILTFFDSYFNTQQLKAKYHVYKLVVNIIFPSSRAIKRFFDSNKHSVYFIYICKIIQDNTCMYDMKNLLSYKEMSTDSVKLFSKIFNSALRSY